MPVYKTRYSTSGDLERISNKTPSAPVEVSNNEEKETSVNQKLMNTIRSDEDKDKLLKSADLVVVKVTASWCTPCQKIQPFYEELAKQYKTDPRIVFATEEIGNVSTSDVESVPTFLFYYDGEELLSQDNKKIRVNGGNISNIESINKVIKMVLSKLN